jgi:hypothetical protein
MVRMLRARSEVDAPLIVGPVAVEGLWDSVTAHLPAT